MCVCVWGGGGVGGGRGVTRWWCGCGEEGIQTCSHEGPSETGAFTSGGRTDY